MILKSDINGDTAIHHAIRHGHNELALTLIREWPDLSQRVNNYNESAMYIAVMRDFDDVFKKLWDTDLSNHNGPYDDNALHAAVKNANLGYLLNGGLEENPLLISASSRGNVDIAREILMHCPDAPYCNRAGTTILHQAVIDGHVKFVDFILQTRQLDKLINIRDSKGRTALHYGVEKCNPKIVRALLSHKDIDVKVYDNLGRPAFWQLIEATDSAKSLNWNEVFMLMSKADPKATTFYVRQVAMKKITVKSKEEIKSLTATYTKTTSLVAILIATITFAVAFSLPGGYSIYHEGRPVMAGKLAFKAFLISDTLAMCSSLAVAFLCILARWEDLEFLLYYRFVINKLMWFALMATNVAFATGLYTVLARRHLWLAILICILSVCLPFLTYLMGNWPMLMLRYRLGPAFKSNLFDMP
ncbi:hypothetical protein LUZ61_004983 [Rhynchospora tenuis]|uniref:PGG domain-containing protein n=1 Tax=Rhynchospora tenuis TaxID=198213 RepID=A0AAD6EU70_9POAL|nr:hypothetical protein LUZ61_004983 [Rhynchospora tenuis]